MEQSEHESASEALVILAQGRRFGPHNLNQMKHRIIRLTFVCNIVCDIAYDMVQRTYDVWLKTLAYDIAYDESIRHRMS